MRTLETAYLKIDTLETCFFCMEDLLIKYTNEKSAFAEKKLENFFYLLWEQLTATRDELQEAVKTATKERNCIIEQLEAENEALRKKLSEFPYTDN